MILGEIVAFICINISLISNALYDSHFYSLSCIQKTTEPENLYLVSMFIFPIKFSLTFMKEIKTFRY